jgi:ATP-dependent Lon protease
MSIQGSILEPDAVGEMVLLARENGARTLFVPAAKHDDIAGLPADLLSGLEFHYFAAPAELVTALLYYEREL